MSMNVQSSGDEPGVMATINTTPLVDVMLVLLIIFLITIPVITHTVPVNLPNANNIPTVTKPQDITIAVNAQGQVFWDDKMIADDSQFLTMVEQQAIRVPQPEVHIRGDLNASYKSVGHVLYELQRGGMVKVAFITQPDQSQLGVH
ncbi:MAG TPA: biopolymer transporter ExbD [Steroidobacteraceae bacterium]|nr:biopolymer transporter ExbD [Steroidobacteraceae bacterium]